MIYYSNKPFSQQPEWLLLEVNTGDTNHIKASPQRTRFIIVICNICVCAMSSQNDCCQTGIYINELSRLNSHQNDVKLIIKNMC